MNGRRAISIAMSLAACAVAAAILLVPTHPERGALSLLAAFLPPNALQNGSAAWWAAESAGNVLLFVPVGALSAIVLGAKRGFLLAVVLSTACELAQQWIPMRHASLTDVILNAIGGAAGALLVGVLTSIARGHARRALPQEAQRQ